MSIPSDIPPAAGTEAPHKPADDREEIYFQGSPLMRGEIGKMLVSWFFGILFIAAPIIWWAVRSDGDWPAWWVTVPCILIGLILLVAPIIYTRSLRYRISNYRIDFERGILSRKIDTLELWHVEDISFRQNVFDRILGVGTIVVISHDETTPRLEMQGLPQPRPLFDSLKQRIIAVKRQRGVIKMDVG
jgi:membrane protein YdbS with pleckstrin-like domain